MIQNSSIGRFGGAAVVVSVSALTALSLAAQTGAPRRMGGGPGLHMVQ